MDSLRFMKIHLALERQRVKAEKLRQVVERLLPYGAFILGDYFGSLMTSRRELQRFSCGLA